MIIYPSEKPLEDVIKANVVSKTIIPISSFVKEPSVVVSESFKNFPSDNKVEQAFGNYNGIDLMYGSAILVSTGINLNDDIFIPSETWAAKKTPINTPYNDQHQEWNIIGHIYNTRVLVDSKVYMDDECPAEFDIECDFVLYKTIFPDKAFEVADGAKSNTKFVSMEAYMDDFCYGIMKDESTVQIVQRNNDTSFLTKYLRIYGGSGEYNGKKIGRVLKSFRFSGMGNVNDPANPKSLYTKIENLEILDTELSNLLANKVYYTKGNKMFKTIEEAIAHIDLVTKELNDLKISTKTEIDTLKQTVATFETEKTNLQANIDAEKSKVDVATQKITDSTKTIADLETKLASASDELSKKTKELSDIKASEILANRVNELTSLKIAVSDERKKTIANMNDEQFKEFVVWAKELSTVKAEEKVDDKKLEDVKVEEVVDLNTTDEVKNPSDDINTIAAKVVSSIRKHNQRNLRKDKK